MIKNRKKSKWKNDGFRTLFDEKEEQELKEWLTNERLNELRKEWSILNGKNIKWK